MAHQPTFGSTLDSIEAVLRVKSAKGRGHDPGDISDAYLLVLISLSRRGRATREEVHLDVSSEASPCSMDAIDRALKALEKFALARRQRAESDDLRRVYWQIRDEGRLLVSKLVAAAMAPTGLMSSAISCPDETLSDR
jgi:hypothetical protein